MSDTITITRTGEEAAAATAEPIIDQPVELDALDELDELDGDVGVRTPGDADALAAARTGELAEQLIGMLGAATELLTIELGRRFGLYRTLRDRGPITAPAFAVAADIAPRYAREWLEQQAAAGYIAVEALGEFRSERRFSLPAEHGPVFIDETHPAHAAPVAGLLAGVALAFPELTADFRHGRGVAFEEYGAELRRGLGALNRPSFTHEMRAWVEQLPDRAAALDAGGVVLDAGCGIGWSTIALATAFPNARVVGLDLDAASIEEARVNARAAGVEHRVSFVLGNAGDVDVLRGASRTADAAASGFDLVTIFEALHDMGRPIDALAGFRALLREDGALLVADERVADEFHAGADPVERMLYAMSVLHCLPATTAESDEIANGTVLRAPTVRRWAAAAGFGRVDVLDIENPFWRFYRIG